MLPFQISDWTSAISLIFGGCCTNAITLEQITQYHPNAGPLVTFFQFLLVSLHGLPKFIIWTRYGPRFRPRRIPLLVYFAQVVLFYLVSVLNNAAFAYHIPMAVHIIFRSGGLVVTMTLGWLISNKRYNKFQINSVILVTAGVVLTTLSVNSSQISSTSTAIDPLIYTKGILILTLALILSGFLGVLQDWAQTKGRNIPSEAGLIAPWQEAMFYLHFLAIPLFIPLLPDMAVQMHQLNKSGPRADFAVPIPTLLSHNFTNILFPISNMKFPIHLTPQSGESSSFLSIIRSPNSTITNNDSLLLSFSIPHIYLPIVLNSLTQLLCIAGVNRLTTRVSSLTVNLVLVIRKALSLVISVFGIEKIAERVTSLSGIFTMFFFKDFYLGGGGGGKRFKVAGVELDSFMNGVGRAFIGENKNKRPLVVNVATMWIGAGMVLLGTLGYAVGSAMGRKSVDVDKKKQE